MASTAILIVCGACEPSGLASWRRMKAIQSWLGLRVRALRLERGWTQEELASRAKKHPTYIGGIERGERNPTLTVLADIARALGVSLAALMEEDRG